MVDTKTLANSLTAMVGLAEPRVASAFTSMEEHPVDNVDLQEIVGDPDTEPLSWNSQFKPSTGEQPSYNPDSPLQGDDVFWNGLFSGARFQAKDGTWWDIENYDFDEASVVIRNVWYPRVEAVVSVQDIRRSIHSWTEPILQRVPPPPPGIDYGVVQTRVVK